MRFTSYLLLILLEPLNSLLYNRTSGNHIWWSHRILDPIIYYKSVCFLFCFVFPFVCQRNKYINKIPLWRKKAIQLKIGSDSATWKFKEDRQTHTHIFMIPVSLYKMTDVQSCRTWRQPRSMKINESLCSSQKGVKGHLRIKRMKLKNMYM